MKYVAMIFRFLIVVVGFKMMALSGWNPNTAPFCSGIGFILVALYFGLMSLVGEKSLSCPFFGGCRNK